MEGSFLGSSELLSEVDLEAITPIVAECAQEVLHPSLLYLCIKLEISVCQPVQRGPQTLVDLRQRRR